MNTSISQAYTRLCTVLEQHRPACLAVSGGLDSRLLSFLIARKRRGAIFFPESLFVHFRGPHVNLAESEAAKNWLHSLGHPFRLITINPLMLKQVANNAHDRCYHCKKFLFTALREQAGTYPLAKTLMDGTNATDTTRYRPGLKALKELKVVSPLALAGIAKEMIYELADFVGLPDPLQAASPCLLTRFPYDTPICPEKLQRIMEEENALHQAGFRNFRVRLHPDGSLHLHAHPDNKIHSHATRLPVHWTRQVSGYFDMS